MKKVFIFDLDDTLMWTEYAYSLAFNEFYLFLMVLWKKRIPYIGSIAALSKKITAQMVLEINPADNKPYGFSMERFPNSLVKCYKELCRCGFGKIQKTVSEQIYEIGMKAFDEKKYRELGFVPFAKETLDFLKQKKDTLILLTRGDVRVQNKKIEVLELDKWFEKFFVVEEKKAIRFAQLRDDFKGNPTFSVGNEFYSDIKPALIAGVKGIYIPCYTWKIEKTTKKYYPSRVFTINSIKKIITLYNQGKLE